MSRWGEVFLVTMQVIWARTIKRRSAVPTLQWMDVVRMLVHSFTGANRLWLSKQYMDIVGADKSLRFAARHVPKCQMPGLSLLAANAAADDDRKWLDQINAYLFNFGTSAVTLSPTAGTRFERLRGAVSRVCYGDMISVIMPVYNAKAVVGYAIESILAQSWKNLELIIVDDCSDDGTWEVLESAASRDTRVRLLRNEVNVGPYVSKNLALAVARGVFVTGHDADDWAHPERLQRDMDELVASRGNAKAIISTMVRMSEQGYFFVNPKPKGIMRQQASISLLIEADWLRRHVGAWDCVRFGADNELIARAELLLGPALLHSERIGMLCLELSSSLSNDPVHGVAAYRRVSPVRRKYKEHYMRWHANLDPADAGLAFPPDRRRFAAPEMMKVPTEAIQQNMVAHSHQVSGSIVR